MDDTGTGDADRMPRPGRAASAPAAHAGAVAAGMGVAAAVTGDATSTASRFAMAAPVGVVMLLVPLAVIGPSGASDSDIRLALRSRSDALVLPVPGTLAALTTVAVDGDTAGGPAAIAAETRDEVVEAEAGGVAVVGPRRSGRSRYAATFGQYTLSPVGFEALLRQNAAMRRKTIVGALAPTPQLHTTLVRT